MFNSFDTKLVLVDVDDVLISGIRLKKGVKLVHLSDVGPEIDQIRWNLEVAEERSCNSDVLKLWHELAIKATHGVSCQEPSTLTCQHLVNPAIEFLFSRLYI